MMLLEERIGDHDSSRMEVQERLHTLCDGWRKQIDELENGISEALETKSTEEDSRLQEALNDLRVAVTTAEEKGGDKLLEAVKKARAELLVAQTYKLAERVSMFIGDDGSVDESEMGDFTKKLELNSEKKVSNEMIDLSSPTSVEVTEISGGKVHVKFTRNVEQERVLAENSFEDTVNYTAEIRKKDEVGEKEYNIRKEENGSFSFVPETLEENAGYTVKVRTVFQGKQSEWSEGAEFTTPVGMWYCSWKDAEEKRKYSVGKRNTKIATKTTGGGAQS